MPDLWRVCLRQGRKFVQARVWSWLGLGNSDEVGCTVTNTIMHGYTGNCNQIVTNIQSRDVQEARLFHDDRAAHCFNHFGGGACPDPDVDGYPVCEDDCNDSDEDIYPGATIWECVSGDVNCNQQNDLSEGWCNPTPIVIDILGDGFDLTNAAGGVLFDLNGDGLPEQLSWTSRNSDDAWLALDRNGSGQIESGLELFGDSTSQPPSNHPNGFVALAEFDRVANGGNDDGQIDRRDAVYASLRVWQDINHNGISEPLEIRTLSSVQLAVLDLDYKVSRRVDQHGNRFRYRSKVKDLRGAQIGRWAWDVILVRGQ